MTNKRDRDSKALARVTDQMMTLAGNYDNVDSLNKALQIGAQNCHLVAPATACAELPVGCSVALSIVPVDVERETYNQAGDRGLHRVVLDKIASAAKVDWEPERSGRLDDGSDPHYCHFRSVGTVKDFDGTERTIVGEKQMDLRNGSPQTLKILEEAKRNKKNGPGQLRVIRGFILEHSETKSRLRAVASIGIRRSYHPDELDKPFLVARLMFTGHSDDREIAMMMAEKVADRHLAGKEALYGKRNSGLRPPVRPAISAPPPIGSVPTELDDAIPERGPIIDTNGKQVTPPPKQSAPQQEDGRVRMPGKKGGFVDEADDKDLTYWDDRLAKSLEQEPNGRWSASNRTELEAIQAELSRRGLSEPEQGTLPGAEEL